MNEAQKQTIKDLLPELVNEMNAEEVIRYLLIHDVLNKGQKKKLDTLTDDRDKCTELFDIITRIESSWVIFLDALTSAKQAHLRRKLEEKGGNPGLQQNPIDQGLNPSGSNRNQTQTIEKTMTALERPIRLAANVHTLKSEREIIASKIDPHDAALFIGDKGIDLVQNCDTVINFRRNKQLILYFRVR